MTCDDCTASREPFYIGANPHFRGVRNGYLPSVCDGCFYKDKPNQTAIIIERETDLRPILGQLQELRTKLTRKNRRYEDYADA